ncbi:AAEL013265-PA [Aedes aegypti]|uniref:AAEL013265-PA n=1 Tax=Aedes aegypti TaxID=7159 RepID=Q16JN9_AEDAE|nr:AAEL013265-PA [Aedes aegypti]
MLEIIHNNHSIWLAEADISEEKLHQILERKTGLHPSEYYLTYNGKRFDPEQIHFWGPVPLRLVERLPGGKGGFGSMLRAIGAQIEKTTNREACRDLSGRRLRDINEEKRLKAYLDKQKEAPEDERAKLQKKIDKLLAKPKHEFHDEAYNRSRTDLTQNVGEAVQEGFRKAVEVEKAGEAALKRKAVDDGKKGKLAKKKAKGALWLGSDDLGSSSDDSSSDSDSEADSACSSGGGKSSEEGAVASSSASSSSSSTKQMVTSEDEKSNPDKKKAVVVE